MTKAVSVARDRRGSEADGSTIFGYVVRVVCDDGRGIDGYLSGYRVPGHPVPSLVAVCWAGTRRSVPYNSPRFAAARDAVLAAICHCQGCGDVAPLNEDDYCQGCAGDTGITAVPGVHIPEDNEPDPPACECGEHMAGRCPETLVSTDHVIRQREAAGERICGHTGAFGDRACTMCMCPRCGGYGDHAHGWSGIGVMCECPAGEARLAAQPYQDPDWLRRAAWDGRELPDVRR